MKEKEAEKFGAGLGKPLCVILKKYESILLFILGFGIFMFTRRSEILPSIQIAIVIAPIFILRFIRIQSTKKGIFLTLLGFLLSMNIALWGLFQGKDGGAVLIFNIVRSSLLAILYFLPYMIDKLIYPKFKSKSFLSTLTFPLTVTAMFFISSIEGPFDGGTAKGVFVYGPAVFKQLASVTGMWSFIFVYSWLASIISFSWENKFNWRKIRKCLYIFIIIIILILAFGFVKISSLMNPGSETVKIAAVVMLPEDGKSVSMEEVFKYKKISDFQKTISKIADLTELAASNNAKIVSFQEFAIVINEEDKSKLLEELRKIALNNNVYLSIAYAYFAKEGKGENIHSFIDNKGNFLLNYTKRFLWGYGNHGETAVFIKGAEVIQAVETPYGKIGLSICRDMNFSSYIRQAAKQNVDIMLSPSYDYPRSTKPSYTLRSIEYGFSFVRPTYNGISFFEDYNGNILTKMDSKDAGSGIIYAEVPTKGVKTLYSVLGDLLGWLCIIGVMVLIVFSIVIKIMDDKKEKNKGV